MATIQNGRLTHDHRGELVVFMIGMRVNRWWRPDQWLPVFSAMSPMLSELSKDPESGMLGFRVTLADRGPLMIMYWDSHEKLYAYASRPDAAHRPAWTHFNQRARRAPGAVGIWHETFQVAAAESIYVGMPLTGLPKATSAVPVGRRGDRARERYAAGGTATAA